MLTDLSATKNGTHKLTDALIKNDTTKLYRLKLKETPIADNEKYNFMSDLGRFGWEHTSCNCKTKKK